MSQYWLMKSEPDTFSIDDLKRVKVEPWDGIRNYQARNFMRDQMQVGDLAFFYHSNCKPPAIVGVMEIASEAYVDHTAFDPDAHYFDPKSRAEKPTWMMVDVKFKKKFPRAISLDELKANPALVDMRLLARGNRLSIMPIETSHWHDIIAMLEH